MVRRLATKINVEGTAAGTTTIINAESGINQFSVGQTPNKFAVGQAANNLDLIAGPPDASMAQQAASTQSRYTTRDDAVVLIASRSTQRGIAAQQRCHHLRPDRRIVDQCAGDRHGDRNFVLSNVYFTTALLETRLQITHR